LKMKENLSRLDMKNASSIIYEEIKKLVKWVNMDKFLKMLI
jgi:hypothetical protein